MLIWGVTHQLGHHFTSLRAQVVLHLRKAVLDLVTVGRQVMQCIHDLFQTSRFKDLSTVLRATSCEFCQDLDGVGQQARLANGVQLSLRTRDLITHRTHDLWNDPSLQQSLFVALVVHEEGQVELHDLSPNRSSPVGPHRLQPPLELVTLHHLLYNFWRTAHRRPQVVHLLHVSSGVVHVSGLVHQVQAPQLHDTLPVFIVEIAECSKVAGQSSHALFFWEIPHSCDDQIKGPGITQCSC
mmetsp:Transcript_98841/g.288332  ORF Transcript_98841/g.288332 Transcript_98841/m.288332 type:complete len:240 (+) Transcript_98841:148-867(+)